MQTIIHALEHTVDDSIFVIVVLFLTYLAMEYMEHYAGGKIRLMVSRAGKFGPAIGAAAGAIPQCGFSAAASNLYAGRLITTGTLIAVYLSTSDEMLPVMISAQAPVEDILGIIAVKFAVGMAAGFLIDLILKDKPKEPVHIHEICEQEHCECEKGIFRSALKHTIQVGIFVLLISFALNMVLELIGEDVLAGFLLNRPILGPVVAGLIGFIPNCAASVAVTELYLQGLIGLGTMLSGLLVGAGVGILVLFRVNHHRKENFKIMGILYLIGVIVGVIAELL